MTLVNMTNPHAACYALEAYLDDYARNNDNPGDAPQSESDSGLIGLTIIDHPHITASGSIVANRLYTTAWSD